MSGLIEFLHQNFSLPDGGLYSNVIASILLGIAGFFYGKAYERRAAKRHTQLMKHVGKIHHHLNIED